MDWYGILQVDPAAEDVTIKKQYKKLALLLHPDKNKYAGAEAAFKLIGEALQILSDKQQRMLYDTRRKPSARGGNVTQRNQNRQASNNIFTNSQVPSSHTFITICPSCQTRYQYYRVYENQNLLCHQCRVPFIAREYVAANGSFSAFGWQHFNQAQQGFNRNTFQSFPPATNFSSGMPFMTDHLHGGVSKNGIPPAFTNINQANQVPAERADMEDIVQELKRKKRDEEKELRRIEKEQQKKAKADLRAQEVLDREFMRRQRQEDKLSGKGKKRHSRKHSSDSSEDNDDKSDEIEAVEYVSDVETLNHIASSNAAPRRSSRPRRNVTYKVDVSDDEDASRSNLESMEDARKTSMDTTGHVKVSQDKESSRKEKLAELVKRRIRVNLGKSDGNMAENEGKGVQVNNLNFNVAHDAHEYNHPENRAESPAISTQVDLNGGSMHAEAENKVHEVGNQAEGESKVQVDREKEDIQEEEDEEEEPEVIAVPDPEFHDFDAARQEKDVEAGQIWACYDDVDGLPRFYFRVKEVLSRNPFKVQISWLDLWNMSNEQYALKDLGFWPTCGTGFKSKGGQILDSVNTFSHIVTWEKALKGQVMIYPRKGDVWALYRNWKAGHYFRLKDLQQYDMVEVLADFSKQTGVIVARLEKLPEHKTVFKRTNVHLEILPSELCKFSYRVPAYLLREDELPGMEVGCFELDPASVPLTDIFPNSGSSKSP
ncbi:hypothetical protein KP509_1Z097000 [Ceratopteris richardii]|nr:hypothetical protein KP509_1Z097000 [Ceratopteris richardii]